MSTMIGNQRVEIRIESFGAGLVYICDPQCPWITTEKESDSVLLALADDTFADRAEAYQAYCDRIRPIASEGKAVDMYNAAKLAERA